MASAEQIIAGLVKERGDGKTFCPSEAARVLAGSDGDWHAEMAKVHQAVDTLFARGEVTLSWKGQRLESRNGPYRIGREE